MVVLGYFKTSGEAAKERCWGRSKGESKMRRVRRSASRRLIPLAPPPSSLAISVAMRGNRSANTKPELIVRRTLHRLGYRYRLHVSGLPGRPDIVFASIRRVVQI